jgi:FMN reductase
MTNNRPPFIVGLGGTTRDGSSSEMAVRYALKVAERMGAETDLIAGSDLIFPMFAPEQSYRHPRAERLIDLLRRSDGIIIASPGYHGSISGLIKNALDYTEDMRTDSAVYFDGRAVGSIVCAAGWQTTGTTLTALRSIVHALRGWPTPMGVGINTTTKVFDKSGVCLDEGVAKQLEIMASQVVQFARMRTAFAATADAECKQIPNAETRGRPHLKESLISKETKPNFVVS